MRVPAAGVVASAATIAALAPGAVAQPPAAGTARLEGQFQLTGRVTVARHVLGEQAGQTVVRTWAFTPLCPEGPCQTIALARQRAAGTDYLVLHLVATNLYAGSGKFYVPLRCGRRIYNRGESAPFKITVQITAASTVNGVPVATQLSASYTNPKRTNLTRCVAAPGHDAAVYDGSPVS